MSQMAVSHHESFRDMRHVRNSADLRRDGSPGAAIYGDTVGGKSFTNEEAAALEDASASRRTGADHGWKQVWCAMTCWTIIDCRPASQRDRREYAEALAME